MPIAPPGAHAVVMRVHGAPPCAHPRRPRMWGRASPWLELLTGRVAPFSLRAEQAPLGHPQCTHHMGRPGTQGPLLDGTRRASAGRGRRGRRRVAGTGRGTRGTDEGEGGQGQAEAVRETGRAQARGSDGGPGGRPGQGPEGWGQGTPEGALQGPERGPPAPQEGQRHRDGENPGGAGGASRRDGSGPRSRRGKTPVRQKRALVRKRTPRAPGRG